jgi:hypothetical protein
MISESAHPIHASATLTTSSGEGPLRLADETAPLLTPKLAPHSRRSSFVDDNAGLLLVAASQLFVSAMNLTVKVLKSEGEPVPTLEVWSTLTGYILPPS